ncbi:ParA family partition ATPase [Roseospirillum parvum]|uniref:Chromosome partitioning protein n=1 Tax=Roseospirillum parvum TaxID=83401 RepID=A0A1G7XV46_9PROT|nr:ParA family partition ATPase [Roseospirillum parvum]SDG87630.1 chromosome partitioning protein [Roseospirillum parvum]
MAVVTVAQQKGGAGKTTLVAQLAVALAADGRRRVALLDIDPQGSLAAWFAVRRQRLGEAAGGLALSAVAGWRVGTELDRLRRGADLILIDTPPHAETEARAAIRAADLVLIPLQPSPMDLWATAPTLEAARSERRAARLVANRMPARGTLRDRVLADLAEKEMPLAGAMLGSRVAFAHSMMEGLGVLESAPRDRAAEEVSALADEVLGVLAGRS